MYYNLGLDTIQKIQWSVPVFHTALLRVMKSPRSLSVLATSL